MKWERWDPFAHPPTERVRTAFLFFPKRIGGETRWLETATWFEESYWPLSPHIMKWMEPEAEDTE